MALPAWRLAALLVAFSPALAAQELHLTSTDGGVRMAVAAPLRLETIGLRDFHAAPGHRLGAVRERAGGSGSGLKVAASAAVPLPALPDLIERELPVHWQVRVPADVDPSSLRVRAEWETDAGLRGSDSPTVPAQVLVQGPWLVESDERTRLYEGSVVLRIPVERLTRSGDYRGRLVLDVERD